MDHKHTSDLDRVTGHLDSPAPKDLVPVPELPPDPPEDFGQLLECPKGTLTSSEIVGYLRTSGDGPLPREVQAHLRTCPACASTLKFLRRTDPIVQRWDQERISLVIKEVLADEVFVSAEEGSRMDPAKRKAAIQKVRERLLTVKAVRDADLLGFVREIEVASGPLADSRVLEICGYVRGIEDNLERFEAARRVAKAFGEAVENTREHLKIEDLFSLMQSETLTIPQGGWQLSFVASFPHTSFFREPVLLDSNEEGQPMFHVENFRKVMPEYDQVCKTFNRQRR